jgi:hypothetical protein
MIIKVVDDYHLAIVEKNPTVVEQRIPNHLMIPIELWLLTRIFKSEADGDGCYFFTQEGPNIKVEIDDEFALTLDKSRAIDPSFCQEVEEAIDEGMCDVDKLGKYWRIFQRIIRRSNGELPYVRVEGAVTCGGLIVFGHVGGGAIIITADDIDGMSSHRWAHDRLVERGFLEGD